MKEIRHGAFCKCKSLRRVTLNEGLEKLGRKGAYYDDDGHCKYYQGVFEESGLEEITLPSTLTEIGETTFKDTSVKAVYVNDDCEADFLELQMP